MTKREWLKGKKPVRKFMCLQQLDYTDKMFNSLKSNIEFYIDNEPYQDKNAGVCVLKDKIVRLRQEIQILSEMIDEYNSKRYKDWGVDDMTVNEMNEKIRNYDKFLKSVDDFNNFGYKYIVTGADIEAWKQHETLGSGCRHCILPKASLTS